MRAQLLKSLPIVALLFAPLISHGHDFWIEPDRLQVSEGEQVNISLREGEDLKGDSLPYITEWFDDFSQSDEAGRRAIESELGNDPAAVIVAGPSTTLLGYHSRRNFVELTPEKFATYLRDEGMENILRQRKENGEDDQPAREYFVRCAKALLNSGSPSDDRLVSRPLGYPLELVPESNPYSIGPGSMLSIRLIFSGQPIEGVRVRAFTRDQPENPIDARTDIDGRVEFNLPRSGVWLIKSVHMVRLENDPKAQWQSFWASLLFRLD